MKNQSNFRNLALLGGAALLINELAKQGGSDRSANVDSSLLKQLADSLKSDPWFVERTRGAVGATGPTGATGATGATGPRGNDVYVASLKTADLDTEPEESDAIVYLATTSGAYTNFPDKNNTPINVSEEDLVNGIVQLVKSAAGGYEKIINVLPATGQVVSGDGRAVSGQTVFKEIKKTVPANDNVVRNIFNGNVINGFYIGTGQIAPTENANSQISDFQEVEEGKTYVALFGHLSNFGNTLFYNEYEQYIGRGEGLFTTGVTAPPGAKKCKFTIVFNNSAYLNKHRNHLIFVEKKKPINFYRQDRAFFNAAENPISGYVDISTPPFNQFRLKSGKNLFDFRRVSKGFYLDSSGGVNLQVNNDLGWVSDWIPAKENTYYTRSGGASTMVNGLSFFDENYSLIQATWTPAATYLSPAGTKFIRFNVQAWNDASGAEANYRYLQLEEGQIATSFSEYGVDSSGAGASIVASVLTDKKVIALGDSITEEAFSWFWILKEKTRMLNSSSTVAVGGREIGTYLDPPAGQTQADVNNKIIGADYVLIVGGANHRGGKPIGTPADAADKTGSMCAQIRYTIEQIRILNATCKIILITQPTDRVATAAVPVPPMPAPYAGVLEYARAESITGIDGWNMLPVQTHTASFLYYRPGGGNNPYTWSGDGTHPNRNGHAMFANNLLTWLIEGKNYNLIS